MTVQTRLDDVLKEHHERLWTRCIAVGEGVCGQTASLIGDWMPPGPWALVADGNTWEAAGREVEAVTAAAGQLGEVVVLEPEAGHGVLVANDLQVQELIDRWTPLAARPRAAVAVGAGTVNDIVKLACYRLGIPYAVVATAPSMNGFTSAIAAVLSDGVKVTVPCRPPVVCLFDTAVLRDAPYRMIASGLGDLMSRPVSMTDWLLGVRLLGGGFSEGSREVAELAGELVTGRAAAIGQLEPEAVTRLAASLGLSGIAMCLAGSSAPASGGEHLISHFLDMHHHAHGTPHDLHGCQVGVGTLVSAGFYERLMALTPADVDVDGSLARRMDEVTYLHWVDEAFGPLAASVAVYAKRKHPSSESLQIRLTTLRDKLPELQDAFGSLLRPQGAVLEDLRLAGCPASFGELGVPPDLARKAVLLGRHIRDRYTILDLAAELGMLESWTDEVLPAVL